MVNCFTYASRSVVGGQRVGDRYRMPLADHCRRGSSSLLQPSLWDACLSTSTPIGRRTCQGSHDGKRTCALAQDLPLGFGDAGSAAFSRCSSFTREPRWGGGLPKAPCELGAGQPGSVHPLTCGRISYTPNVGTRGFDRGGPCGIAGRGATTPRKKVAQQ